MPVEDSKENLISGQNFEDDEQKSQEIDILGGVARHELRQQIKEAAYI